MVRCHTFRDRPAHYDQLHFDLWWRGQNILCDSGTYQYFPPEGQATEDYFQLIHGHNTVEIDGESPVERVSRFLFFPWPQGKLRHFAGDEASYRYFEGEHYDYDRRPWHVLHRRAIVGLPDDLWIVIDDLLEPDASTKSTLHTTTLRWHIGDYAAKLDSSLATVEISTPSGQLVSSPCRPIRPTVGSDWKSSAVEPILKTFKALPRHTTARGNRFRPWKRKSLLNCR